MCASAIRFDKCKTVLTVSSKWPLEIDKSVAIVRQYFFFVRIILISESNPPPGDDCRVVSVTIPKKRLKCMHSISIIRFVSCNFLSHSELSSTINIEHVNAFFAPKNGMHGLLGPWSKCRIESVTTRNLYLVKFCGDDGKEIYKFPEYHIAPNPAPDMQLMSETRVIATLNSNSNNYYAGVVGETIHRSNDYMYLIFFDNAHVRYVWSVDACAPKCRQILQILFQREETTDSVRKNWRCRWSGILWQMVQWPNRWYMYMAIHWYRFHTTKSHAVSGCIVVHLV